MSFETCSTSLASTCALKLSSWLMPQGALLRLSFSCIDVELVALCDVYTSASYSPHSLLIIVCRVLYPLLVSRACQVLSLFSLLQCLGSLLFCRRYVFLF
eukprot:c47934_g1_i1 orf=189-488(-)